MDTPSTKSDALWQILRKKIKQSRYKKDRKYNIVENESIEKKYEELMAHVVEWKARRRCGPIGSDWGYSMSDMR